MESGITPEIIYIYFMVTEDMFSMFDLFVSCTLVPFPGFAKKGCPAASARAPTGSPAADAAPAGSAATARLVEADGRHCRRRCRRICCGKPSTSISKLSHDSALVHFMLVNHQLAARDFFSRQFIVTPLDCGYENELAIFIFPFPCSHGGHHELHFSFHL
jgi:hypothetical protein